MRRYIEFAIFGIFFFTMIFLVNFFVISSFTFLLEYPQNWIFWLIVFFSSIIYPLVMMIDMIWYFKWMRPISIIGSLWMGIIVELFFILLIYYIVRQFFEIDRGLALIVILIFTIILTGYSSLASLIIRSKKIELNTSKLNKDLRVVQLSDLHLGSTHRIKYLKRVINSTNSLNPDIILITGDLADDISIYKKEFLPIFNLFKAPIYLSLGNHEIYIDNNFKKLAGQVNIRVLKNEVHDLGNYQIIGIDYGLNSDQIIQQLSNLSYDKTKYTILMQHSPIGFENVTEQGVDLMLSGHTHHGQVFPFNFLIRLAWRKSKGLYNNGNSYLYVSPGTGTWGPPMRFGSFNEETLFVIKGKK